MKELFKNELYRILFYSLAFTFCFYKNIEGILVFIFIVFTFIFFQYSVKEMKIPRIKNSLFYEILMVLIGISIITTGSESLLFLDYIFLLSLMTLYFLQYYKKNPAGIDINISQLLEFIFHSISLIFHPLKKKNKDSLTGKEQKRKKKINIIKGILITIPLFLLILLLLSYADKVFYNFVEIIMGDINFENIKIGNMILACFLFLFSFFAISGILSSINEKQTEEWTALKKENTIVIPIIYTGAITILYFIFSVIQAYYLFLHQGTLPDGISYAEYAREGFFQLLAVVLINYFLITYGKRKYERNKTLDLLYVIMSFLTYILIFSSAYRMILYIQTYSLTFLRVLVLWGLAGFCILFCEILIMLISRRYIKREIYVFTISILYILFAFSRPDQYIVNYNFQKINYDTIDEIEEQVDFYELNHISSDAINSVMELNQELEKDPDYIPGRISYDIIHSYLDRMKNKYDPGVRTFNLSKYIAKVKVEK